jgi:hypothetical protein
MAPSRRWRPRSPPGQCIEQGPPDGGFQHEHQAAAGKPGCVMGRVQAGCDNGSNAGVRPVHDDLTDDAAPTRSNRARLCRNYAGPVRNSPVNRCKRPRLRGHIFASLCEKVHLRLPVTISIFPLENAAGASPWGFESLRLRFWPPAVPRVTMNPGFSPLFQPPPTTWNRRARRRGRGGSTNLGCNLPARSGRSSESSSSRKRWTVPTGRPCGSDTMCTQRCRRPSGRLPAWPGLRFCLRRRRSRCRRPSI